MDTHTEDQDVLHNPAYNPFPEPQTIPAGWDMSEFLSAPRTDSDMNEDNSSEG